MKRYTRYTWIRRWAVIGLALAAAGCSFGEPSQEAATPAASKPAVRAAHIPGDLTYQDVLDKGEHIQVVTMSPDGSRIWLGTHAGLYASADEGLWALAAPELAEDDVTGVFIDPERPNVIDIGGHEVSKRSEDGGRTWKPYGGGLPNKPDIHALAGARERDQLQLYAFVSGEGIYRSLNGGERWEKWVPLDQEASAIAYNPEDKRLYAVTQNGLIALEGQSWKQEEIPGAQQVYSVAVDREEGRLYAATDIGVFRKKGGTWEPLEAKVPEKLLMIGSGGGEHRLVAVGESAALYTLVNGKWKKW